MLLQPLISQDRIKDMACKALAVEATLLPDPEDSKRQVMRVRCHSASAPVDGYLAMVNRPEPRTFTSLESAWKVSRRLGIQVLIIDNEKFAGVAA